jgi:hypothetical protein
VRTPRFSIPRDIATPRVLDPEKIVPPRPNLEGHDVKWVRRDASGKVINWGHMHRDDIARHQAAGDRIEEAPDDLQPPAAAEPDLALQMQYTIAGELAKADRYFLTDALDNITADEQAQWRAYRKALRDANKLTDPAAILAHVPKTPKGIDAFEYIRGKAKR